MKPVFHGEFVERTTISSEMLADPERMLAYIAVRSLSIALMGRERHYNGFGVAAIAPVFDSEMNPKILAASNYRPDPEQNSLDTRVCAEQALIDNSVHEGDMSIGVLFLRGPKPDPNKPIVGCREGAKSLHLCRPCRARMLDVVGPDLLIVTFNDDEAEPSEAMTLGQMLGYHDVGNIYPELPDDKTARDITLDVLGEVNELILLKKPSSPRRRISAQDRALDRDR